MVTLYKFMYADSLAKKIKESFEGEKDTLVSTGQADPLACEYDLDFIVFGASMALFAGIVFSKRRDCLFAAHFFQMKIASRM